MDAADDRVRILPGADGDRPKIGFVEKNDPVPVARTIQKLLGVGAERLRSVDDDERDASRLERAFRALDARRFKAIGVRPDSGGVDESDRYAFDVRLSSIVSRVVPGISETIARSLSSSALSSEDLPALGGPTMATLTPSRISRPTSPSRRSRSRRRR